MRSIPSCQSSRPCSCSNYRKGVPVISLLFLENNRYSNCLFLNDVCFIIIFQSLQMFYMPLSKLPNIYVLDYLLSGPLLTSPTQLVCSRNLCSGYKTAGLSTFNASHYEFGKMLQVPGLHVDVLTIEASFSLKNIAGVNAYKYCGMEKLQDHWCGAPFHVRYVHNTGRLEKDTRLGDKTCYTLNWRVPYDLTGCLIEFKKSK